MRGLKDAKSSAVLAAPAAALAVFAAGAGGPGHPSFVPSAVGAGHPPSFVPSAVAAAGCHVIDVAVADFDGDGTPDLAVASAGHRSNDVSVLLGDGAGRFRPAPGSPIKLAGVTARIVTADFDGDGKVDLAVSRLVPENAVAQVSILLGNGAGGLSAASGSPVELGRQGLTALAAAADLNRDNKADLVTADGVVRLGDGSGRFVPAPGPPVGGVAGVADFNGDGDADLVIGGGGGPSILLGNGSGRFGTARQVAATSGPLTVADLNGDGNPDLAVVGKKLSILLGDGAGAFRATSGSSIEGVCCEGERITTADFNGDGKADLAAAAYNSVVVLIGNGAGRFHEAAASPFSMPGSVLEIYQSSLIADDLNGDGKPDLVTTLVPSESDNRVEDNRVVTMLQVPSLPPSAVARGRVLPGAVDRRLSTRGPITTLAADGDRVGAITSRVSGGFIEANGVRLVVWGASDHKGRTFEAPRSRARRGLSRSWRSAAVGSRGWSEPSTAILRAGQTSSLRRFPVARRSRSTGGTTAVSTATPSGAASDTSSAGVRSWSTGGRPPCATLLPTLIGSISIRGVRCGGEWLRRASSGSLPAARRSPSEALVRITLPPSGAGAWPPSPRKASSPFRDPLASVWRAFRPCTATCRGGSR